MKHLIAISLLMAALFTAPLQLRAQEDDMPPLSEERIKEIKAQKTAYLTTKLGLTSEEAQRFWPVYNEFDEAREKLRREMREVMRTGRSSGEPMTEAAAEQLLARGLSIRERELALERTYKDRFVKVIGAVKTLELHKAERDFQREVLRRYRERMEGRGGERAAPPPGRP
jgi:hypothetical protein